MIKAGGTILEASVVDVWLPTRSEKARPYVTLSISTSWEESDVIAEMKRIKENKIKKQLDREIPQQHESSWHPVLMFLKAIISFCNRLIKK
ncbi:hypothetical protein AI2617V1_3452 [Serratia marcescens]|nr:hypothetical protein AI2617V1_3452 [Serratia marcescens]CAH4002182.1 hypothetical protein AI2617V1_3452 [Serratia marcescens]